MNVEFYVVASRGRPKDGKYIQHAELQPSGTTNTLTGVVKDNLILIKTLKNEEKYE